MPGRLDRHVAARSLIGLIVVMLLGVTIGFSPIPRAHAATRTLYVDPAGSDTSGTGSQAKPWKTIGKSITNAQPGDTILIAAGTYPETITIEELQGTADAPIVFRANGGPAVIDGTKSSRDAVLVTYSSYVTLDGWTVNNAPRAGLRVDNSQHVSILNGVYGNNGTWGIFTDFSDDILIQGNETYGSKTQHGIYHSNSGDRPTIRGNLIHDNYAAGLHMNADWSQGGDGVISGALVEDNIIYNNGAGGGAAINMDGIVDSVVRNNLLFNNHASGIAIFQDDGRYCSNNNQFLNNTIVMPDNGRWPITIPSADCTNNKLFNNILYNAHSYRGSISLGEGVPSGFQSDYNAVINRFSTDDGDSILTLAAWQGLGFDAHSFIATPAQLFVDSANSDFHLKTGSPAIDAGKTLGNVTDDLAGNPRPSGAGFDVGAYERSGGGAPTATFTATATRTPSATPTKTPSPTATIAPTNSPTRTSTSTVVPTSTATKTPIPPATSTAKPTDTATSTQTPLPTLTPTATVTATASNTAVATSTPSNTATATPTNTATASPTKTATATRTPAPAATATSAPTKTPPPTRTPTATATVVVRPSCSVSARTVKVASNLTVSCSGYLPGETVDLYLDSTNSNAGASGAADGNGGVALSIQVPAAPGGSHKVYALGETSRKRLGMSITIGAKLAIEPSSGKAGSTVTISLTGYKAGEVVSVRWYVSASTTKSIRTSLTVGGNGTARLTFTIPATASSGGHKIDAKGDSGTSTSAIFTVK